MTAVEMGKSYKEPLWELAVNAHGGKEGDLG